METAAHADERDWRGALELVRAGQPEALEALLGASPSLLDARDPAGRTLLAHACRLATGETAIPPVPGTPEQHEVVDRLLAAGADPSLSDRAGWAPLHVAAMVGHLDLARRLLVAGAPRSGELMGATGGTPLALALFYGQAAVAEVLATPAVPDNLRCAAALGRDLERFVQAGALTAPALDGLDFYRPLEAFPAWERSFERQEVLDEALCWAARNARTDSMSRLVELGANVDANPYRGTPLTWSVYRDHEAAARWLLDHGADPDLPHDFGGSEHGIGAVSMHLAAQYGGLRCLALLLERGARTDLRDRAHGGTPLDWARFGSAEGAVKLLEAAAQAGS